MTGKRERERGERREKRRREGDSNEEGLEIEEKKGWKSKQIE